MATNAMFELTIFLVQKPDATNEEVQKALSRKGFEIGIPTINTTRSSTRRTLNAIQAAEQRTKRNKRDAERRKAS